MLGKGGPQWGKAWEMGSLPVTGYSWGMYTASSLGGIQSYVPTRVATTTSWSIHIHTPTDVLCIEYCTRVFVIPCKE